jgi:hypothetical protein
MEEIANIRMSWFSLLLLGALLVGGYFLLQLLKRILLDAPLTQNFSEPLRMGLEKFTLMYEPLAIILLAVVFVYINPIVHGSITLIMLLLGFQHLRDYLSGRLVLLGEGVVKGTVLEVGERRGTVARLGRLGLRLQTDGGVHHIGYGQLVRKGYTSFSNEEEVGKFRSFYISLPKERERSEQLAGFMDLLTTSPFIDWSYKPQVAEKRGDPRNLKVTAFFREERHFLEFSRLIDEWGLSGDDDNKIVT